MMQIPRWDSTYFLARPLLASSPHTKGNIFDESRSPSTGHPQHPQQFVHSVVEQCRHGARRPPQWCPLYRRHCCRRRHPQHGVLGLLLSANGHNRADSTGTRQSGPRRGGLPIWASDLCRVVLWCLVDPAARSRILGRTLHHEGLSTRRETRPHLSLHSHLRGTCDVVTPRDARLVSGDAERALSALSRADLQRL